MITIPKSAVTESDDGGESVAPAVGDTVNLSNVTAKVVGEDGDNFKVEVQSVNGCDCGEGEMDDAGEEAPKDGDALLLLAKKEDKKNGMED